MTPLHVLTPRGGRHLYFRFNGELRRIKPITDVDFLGSGPVVAAGSETPRGRYEIERGSLDDLDRLPLMKNVPPSRQPAEPIPDGMRNDTVFKRLLREARHCDDFESLLDVARSINMDCIPPLTDARLVSTAKSAWGYETSGNNWVGRKARASTDREEILSLSRDPAAAMLLMLLRVSHPGVGDRFAIEQKATAKLLGWDRDRVQAKISALIEMKRLRKTYNGGQRKGDTHQYELVR